MTLLTIWLRSGDDALRDLCLAHDGRRHVGLERALSRFVVEVGEGAEVSIVGRSRPPSDVVGKILMSVDDKDAAVLAHLKKKLGAASVSDALRMWIDMLAEENKSRGEA